MYHKHMWDGFQDSRHQKTGIFERQEANDCDVAIRDCHSLLPFASVQIFSPSAMLKIYIYD